MSKPLFYLLAILGFYMPRATATYSIVACDAKTRECGVAVQTNNLAVGASVPYAQAGVGAIASQFETNPNYGPRGLALLAQGKNPSEVLVQLLKDDGNFEGQGPEARQVGIVSIDGRTAVHSGEQVKKSGWTGSRSGPGYSIQGNGLAGTQVVDAMEQAFLKTSGLLAERLLAAVTAGDSAGGQKTGRESAALLVKTTSGWPADIDLRVDHSADPVADLRLLLNMQLARQQIGQARSAAKDGHFDEAKSLLIGAVSRASTWSRIWLQAAQVAQDIEEPELAVQYLNVAFSQNAAWIDTTIGDGDYANLGHDPAFHRWVRSEDEREVMNDYEVVLSNDTTVERRLEIAAKLLEVDHSSEAVAVLKAMPAIRGIAQGHVLMADAYAAQRQYKEALEQCRQAMQIEPGSEQLQRKAARLQREMQMYSGVR